MLLKIHLVDNSNPTAPTSSVRSSPPSCVSSSPRRYDRVAMNLPTDESGRLESLYSKMTDGELEKIAAEASSLTDLARAALQSEMHRRSMYPSTTTEAELAAADPEVSFQHLVPVRRFRDLP